MATANSADQPWYTAFPEPSCKEPSAVPASTLLKMLQDGRQPGRDFLLIDVRRTDHEGGTIRGSLNLPAQTVYYSLESLLALCKAAGITLVMWYCGSSGGRGTRTAGWFDDVVKARGHKDIQSSILAGGIKGWVKAGQEYRDMMDGYNGQVWGLEKQSGL